LKDNLLNKVIFSTQFVWEDLVNFFPGGLELYKLLNPEKQEKIYEKNHVAASKGFECGLMTDWEYIGKTIVSCFDGGILDVISKSRIVKKDGTVFDKPDIVSFDGKNNLLEVWTFNDNRDLICNHIKIEDIRCIE
jgi:hypothetical protein